MTVTGLEAVTVDTGTGPLTYHRGGSEGAPLVLLNALGQSLAPWARLVDELLPRRLHVWETRGTTPPYRPCRLAEHVDDLVSVLCHESVDRCHLVGWCTGPKVALAFWARRPDTVASMVFLNAAFKHPGRAAELDTRYEVDLEALCRAVVRRPESAGRLRQLFAFDAFVDASDMDGDDDAGLGIPDELVAAARRPFSSEDALVAYARQHVDFWEDDALAPAADVDVPILFVGAERDRIVSPEGVRSATRLFPRSHHVEIGGGTHFALFERAAEVGELIRQFVTSPAPSPAR